MEPLHDHDELKDASFLRSLPKADPFVVPEGFFERFPHQVQAQVGASKNSLFIEWIARTSLALRVAGITAVLALVTATAFLLLREGPVAQEAFAAGITVSPNELDLDIINEHDLFAMIDDAPELMSEAGEGLSSDEMAAYLENEEIPFDLLIEEL